MNELEMLGVQHRTWSSQSTARSPIGRIPNDRMPNRLEVHANLMSSSGFERARHQGHETGNGKTGDDVITRSCLLAIDDDRHLRWIAVIATNRSIDDSRLLFRMTPHQR